MKHHRNDEEHGGAAAEPGERKMLAAIIASGLISAHGIDHAGAPPEKIAETALAIGDAICKAVDSPPEEEKDQADTEEPKEE